KLILPQIRAGRFLQITFLRALRVVYALMTAKEKRFGVFAAANQWTIFPVHADSSGAPFTIILKPRLNRVNPSSPIGSSPPRNARKSPPRFEKFPTENLQT